MIIDILMIGKIKQKPFQNLIEDYLKRCNKRLTVSLIHCKSEEEMRRRVDQYDLRVNLDEKGQTMNSMEFAAWLDKLVKSGQRRISIAVGGPEGFTDLMKRNADQTISLSQFTLNHQLALLVFAEQLYRGLTIIFNEPYHKHDSF